MAGERPGVPGVSNRAVPPTHTSQSHHRSQGQNPSKIRRLIL